MSYAVRARTRVHVAGTSSPTLCGSAKRVRPVEGQVPDCQRCIAKSRTGTLVYLIHFAEPYEHARHYVGWTQNLPWRLGHHRAGTGSRLMAAVSKAGIDWAVVRTWPGASRSFERRIKAKAAARWCPVCSDRPRVERRRG